MILADKIIEERKRAGLSQEELAEKLSVSRQAVSKWESAQSIPDLAKIVALSELFSVTTDYLLKDDAVKESANTQDEAAEQKLRRVSMEEANDFLSVMRKQAKTVALGVLLCIVSPVLLILLTGFSEEGIGGVTEKAALAIGLSALLLLIATAVFLFIRNGAQTEKYESLTKESFETAYGVTGLVREKKEAYQPTYISGLSIGIMLCVLSPLPLILSSVLRESPPLVTGMTALLLCIVAAGVYIILRVGNVMTGYRILLQEGEYRKEEKKKNTIAGAVSAVYWSLVTAVYLGWSFLSGRWESTWIIWPVAGVLCAPILAVAKLFDKEGRS